MAGTLEKLYARRRFGIRPGLDRVAALLERLGHPEQNFRTIHVVGTNGKGSTSAFLSSILTAAGHRTAFFSSPHLVSFGERFRINRLEANEERLAPLLDAVLKHAPPEATFFEIVTAVATLYFAEESVDVAVMEAGMGGASDATAALPGIMTVITPISFDHCDYLGSTLLQIASEKSAIAEAGTPVAAHLQPPEAEKAITTHCTTHGNQLTWVGDRIHALWNDNGTLDYYGIHAKLSHLFPGIRGRYQASNAALALAAAEILTSSGLSIPQAAMAEGVQLVHWPGRMELVDGSPPLLLDGAHNPAGAAALAQALDDYHYDRLLLVVGVMGDKNVHELLLPLANRAAQAFTVTPAVERALDATALATQLTELGLTAQPCATVADGIRAARAAAAPGDLILICGSLFTVGEAKAVLGGDHFEGVRG